LKPVVCNPYDVVEKSIAAILPQAQQKEITLNIECHQKQTMGVYDEDKLTAILTNLLSNAVKFTEQGEVCIVINPGLNGTEIIISDTGIGISESDLTNIFDEFRQLDYPGKHKPTGFGMGLTIVATLVEVIGGSLTVSSKKRIGTAFTLYVPTLDPHRQAE
ncbi:MAG TPA: HAMP domain-containing sensor histidine kinase, partial [Armatimonadota bacterium]|nr:HAMP domain-containing sensor histidine kinase [Armatimonadota bacterium]